LENAPDYERQAASGGVQPKLAVESHDHSIPLREKTDETIIKGIALAACKDIAVAIEREKRIIELLSTPQTVKELEMGIHGHDVVFQENKKPSQRRDMGSKGCLQGH